MNQEPSPTTPANAPTGSSTEHNNSSSATLPSAFSLFSSSKAAFSLNLVAFLVVIGMPALLSSLGSIPLSDEARSSLEIFSVIGGLASLIFGPGAILLELKSARAETMTYNEAISQGLKFFWRYLGLTVLTAIILLVSLLLLVVPFFIVLPRIVLAPYYLIDRKLGVVEALKASNADYKKHKGTWGVIGVVILLALTSIIPFIGWAISIVLLLLYVAAFAIRYEQIQLLNQGKKPVTPIELKAASEN